jgi:hypothetical protein
MDSKHTLISINAKDIMDWNNQSKLSSTLSCTEKKINWQERKKYDSFIANKEFQE